MKWRTPVDWWETPVYCVMENGTLIAVPYWENFVNRVAGGSVERAAKMLKEGYVRVVYPKCNEDVVVMGDNLVVFNLHDKIKREQVPLPRDLREF